MNDWNWLMILLMNIINDTIVLKLLIINEMTNVCGSNNIIINKPTEDYCVNDQWLTDNEYSNEQTNGHV